MALFGLLMLLITSCAVGQTPPSGTPASTMGTSVLVYFARHPDTDNNPAAVFAVARTTTETTLQARATYALEQMLGGPTQTERTQGYYSPFDGQLALQSTCPGSFRDFDLALDHKGATPQTGTATVQFCRRVDIPGDLDGPRMAAMVTSTLQQFSTIQKVVILNQQGNCFDDLQGTNACLDGQASQTGYVVKVFFSKHPDSDNTFNAVFAVKRTSPDLGVATYAVQQLIAGPTSAEQQQGYFTELTADLQKGDPSSCGGADFIITLDHRGTAPETGTATLQFCRTILSGGIGADARMGAELQATLTQFPTIKQAVILNKQGNCFGDESTQNRCLQHA